MLQQLLILIDKGEQFSQIELAEKLGVSLSLLSEMIERLIQMGYLENLNCSTFDHCKGCPVKGACHPGASQHIWSLTPKGRQAART